MPPMPPAPPVPLAPPAYGYGPAQPPYPPPPVAPKPKSKIGIWIALGAVVVIGLVVALVILLSNPTATPVPSPTTPQAPTTTESVETPTPSPTEIATPSPTESSTFSDSFVGQWKNIMTVGQFRTMEFTADGRFTILKDDGETWTGEYEVIAGNYSEGTIKCWLDHSDMTIEGDFHLNGNILTWGNMMFLRES
jgi:hypothetical protein